MIDETNSRNEILTKRISDLEAKLELSQSQQSFYKKAFENAEIQVKKLTDENDRNKSHLITDQKEEIQRLRSELTLAVHKNEEKWNNLVKSAPNQLVAEQQQLKANFPTVSTSSTLHSAMLMKDDITIQQKSPFDTFKYGNHPGSKENRTFDIHEHISLLQKEKAMFLKTKVYSNDDPIVKQLSEKIDALLQKKKDDS